MAKTQNTQRMMDAIKRARADIASLADWIECELDKDSDNELTWASDIPIIVMTSHGHDSPDLAVEVLRCDGATDFVKKTFADSGHTLEKAIQDALATSGRSLILFGAGASYGSDRQGTPPLGPRLFDALRASSPNKWGQISATEAAAFKPDFEKGMKEYAETPANYRTVDPLQRDMAAYFFRFEPRETDLYMKFARWMRDTGWKGAVASLNYERLFELSLQRAGLSFSRGEASSDSIALCLPHGCCNLFGNIGMVQCDENAPRVHVVAPVPIILKLPDGTEARVDFRTQQGGPISSDPNLQLDGQEIEVFDDPSDHAAALRRSPPVMCYFQPDKETKAGVTFIKRQRERFRALVGSASVVAIVGVKVRPHDRHLWDPLKQTAARLVYCAGKRDASEFNSWAGNCKRKGDRAIPAFWTDGFDEICEALVT